MNEYSLQAYDTMVIQHEKAKKRLLGLKAEQAVIDHRIEDTMRVITGLERMIETLSVVVPKEINEETVHAHVHAALNDLEEMGNLSIVKSNGMAS